MANRYESQSLLVTDCTVCNRFWHNYFLVLINFRKSEFRVTFGIWFLFFPFSFSQLALESWHANWAFRRAPFVVSKKWINNEQKKRKFLQDATETGLMLPRFLKKWINAAEPFAQSTLVALFSTRDTYTYLCDCNALETIIMYSNTGPHGRFIQGICKNEKWFAAMWGVQILAVTFISVLQAYNLELNFSTFFFRKSNNNSVTYLLITMHIFVRYKLYI